jgi:DNA polymerase-3 subunit epsilon
MYLVFDTETTGLPKSREARISDVDNWPRVVQLAWESFDPRGRKTYARSYVIRPDGFRIPKDAVAVHGISTSIATRIGIPITKALNRFLKALRNSSVVIAHGYEFDSCVLGAEFHRLGMRDQFRGKTHVCTMEDSTEYCAIPSRFGFKWPKLPELHLKLFRKIVKETHDAAADVAVCSRCFFELKRLGVVHIRSGAHR